MGYRHLTLACLVAFGFIKPASTFALQTDATIRLSGYLDTSESLQVVRSMFEVTATPKHMSVVYSRKVLGTAKPEAMDFEAKLKIVDAEFVQNWRASALTAYSQSPIRRGLSAETRLPEGFWVIFPERLEKEFADIKAEDNPGKNGSVEFVKSTVAKFDDMVQGKNYDDLSVRLSEGDLVPAAVVDLKDLISNPKKWGGKRVRVSGWASVAEEERLLYPSRFRAWRGGMQNIWIGETSSASKNPSDIQPLEVGPRIVEGVVRADDHGHLGASSVCTIDRLTINRRSQ